MGKSKSRKKLGKTKVVKISRRQLDQVEKDTSQVPALRQTMNAAMAGRVTQ